MMLTNGTKTSIDPTPPRFLAWEIVAIAFQDHAQHIRSRGDGGNEPGLRRSREAVRRLPAAALGGDGSDLRAPPAVLRRRRGYACGRAAVAVRAANRSKG